MAGSGKGVDYHREESLYIIITFPSFELWSNSYETF